MGVANDQESFYQRWGDTHVFFLPFIAPLLNIVGSVWQGNYCFATAAFTLILLPVVDTVELTLRKLFGLRMNKHYPSKPLFGHDGELTPQMLLLWVYVPLYFYSLLACAQVYGDLTGWEKFGMSLSLSAANSYMMVTAHELCHKRNKISQALGLLGTAIIANPDFVYDHGSFHHAHAATPKDPQTAPLGMALYTYTARIFVRVYSNAGNKLLNKLSSGKVDRLVIWFALVIFSVLLCFQFGGLGGLSLFWWHYSLGYFFLSSLSYAQHYGMLRKQLPNGEYEPMNLYNTSWDSDFWFSNVCFWASNHHAAHHIYPRKLHSQHDFESDTPKWPHGTVLMIYMTFCPPAWFWCMDKRVLAHRELLAKVATKDGAE